MPRFERDLSLVSALIALGIALASGAKWLAHQSEWLLPTIFVGAALAAAGATLLVRKLQRASSSDFSWRKLVELLAATITVLLAVASGGAWIAGWPVWTNAATYTVVGAGGAVLIWIVIFTAVVTTTELSVGGFLLLTGGLSVWSYIEAPEIYAGWLTLWGYSVLGLIACVVALIVIALVMERYGSDQDDEDTKQSREPRAKPLENDDGSASEPTSPKLEG
jgi:hypothetical protein